MAALRALLAASWGDPGRSWPLLGPAWAIWACLGAIFARCLAVLGPVLMPKTLIFALVLYMFVNNNAFCLRSHLHSINYSLVQSCIVSCRRLRKLYFAFTPTRGTKSTSTRRRSHQNGFFGCCLRSVASIARIMTIRKPSMRRTPTMGRAWRRGVTRS